MRSVGGIAAGLAALLSRLRVIEESRLRSTVDLAWPRIVTGFAIMSKRTVDLAIVGIAIGPAAVAGLTLANAYWMVGKFMAIGLAGGTITLVSQNYGGDEPDRAALAVKQGVWVTLALGLPTAGVLAVGAGPLIDLVGEDPASVGYGASYLAVVAPALLFEFLNLIASRTYAGVSDTVTPMVMRAGGAVLNIVLSATFVFGLGMGVVGAGLGTAIATALVTVAFTWGMSGRSYLGRGASPIPLTASGPHYDGGLLRQLLRVGTPLIARRGAQGLVVFPLLAIAATFGPVAVAAVGVARQVRALMNSFSWGFSIAASTLVGQALGAGDDGIAEAYGSEITRLSVVIYTLVALAVVVLATPIAGVFVDRAADVQVTGRFVRVAAVSVIPLGVDGSVTGALRGAGDTRIPFLATLLGLYVGALPVAWLGTVTALGILGLQAALLIETAVPMAVNVHRFRTNRWKAISGRYSPSAGD